LDGQRLEFSCHSQPVGLQARLQVLQNQLPRLFIESEIAVSGQARDSTLDFPDDLLTSSTEQREESLIKAKFAPLVADEIENQASCLPGV